MNRRLVWLATLALALVGTLVACGGNEERKPNVVLILVDTLRPDHLQAYGYQRPTSPFLSGLAQRGVLCERAFSASTWTAPSTASLFTGLYPNQHGITEGFFVHRKRAERDGAESAAEEASVALNRLPEGVPTVPELFERAGYATFGASCNVNVTSRIGFDRGFGQFADFTGPQYGKGANAEQVLAQLRTWKPEIAGERPYFLYLHFNDVHSPWTPHKPAFPVDNQAYGSERSQYDGELRFLDRTLEQISRELGWNDDTLVVVVSDHGEEFGEHGALGHGYSVHNELMRIVMLYSWPAVLPQGRRIVQPVSILDVLPTLAQLVGLDVPQDRSGVSLAPSLAGRAEPPERTLFALRLKEGGTRQLWAAQRGNWKLILSGTGAQLYDHSIDPLERKDVSREHPETVERLLGELREFRAGSHVRGGTKVDVELDADAIKALEQLGYTDKAGDGDK
jgi:arylsulfatase A-like enzyme